MNEIGLSVRSANPYEVRLFLVDVIWARHYRDILKWLKTNYGEGSIAGSNPQATWSFNDYTVGFREETDRTAFLLRFS